ncbi:hypothetical protein FOA52_000847 [Chlamydomonas sp. UWO 241]|nr:hypothetical protein FOA52_000847 [Chlamydomonas sp. UWO 241]
MVNLTLENVRGASDLQPLATASLARLPSLTVCQAPTAKAWVMPMLCSRVAATLREINVNICASLRSIDFVRSCPELKFMFIGGCVGVSSLSPLATCPQLEALWMPGCVGY